MTESTFSTYWYRVAKLKPLLRNAVLISRHVYRDQVWYVLTNSLSGRSHRFNTAAYALIGHMDGERTVQEIWEHAGKLAVDATPTQDEFIRLLGRLHDADLIQSDILPSTVDLLQQAQGQSKTNLKQRITNPFSLRFPLWDPEPFLDRWSYLTAPLFSRSMFFVWLLVVLSALVAAIMHSSELSNELADRLFLPNNLLLLWLIYPVAKIFHEFSHAFAVKRWGGEVHEMGITLLALTPLPYIDASASASLPEKKHRICVAAMGMMVELLMASIALFVWLNVETGLISALSYNLMLIGGVSTLLFNGNPLLRYDGYYMLADLVEIPNLGQRSTRYLGYLLQRYLLGIKTAESPVTAPGEQAWFLVYGPIAFCYRIAVLVGLVWLVSSRAFIVGVLIALWGVITLLIIPAVRSTLRFLDNPAVRNQRSRLTMVSGGAALAVVLIIFVVPMPFWTNTQGVVWLPEQSTIRAGTDCEVVEVLAPVEQLVAKDEPLIRGVDPFLKMEIEVYRARLEELSATYNSQPLHERVKRKMVLDEIKQVEGDLHQIEEKLEKLLIRSPTRGKFILTDARNLTGRFVKKGELLGYIVSEHRPTIRAVISQAAIGLVRERVTGVEVRLTEKPARSLKADIERIIPSADLNLPSAALGTTGGGIVPVDPTDPDGQRALESLFQIDLSLPDEVKNPHIGSRVYVRLDHGSMSLAMQWYRSLRQLFLRKFYV